MAAIRHLLVPTDGSEGALKAAAFAGELARSLGARVSVLYVQSEDFILPHAWGPGSYPAGAAQGSMSVEEVRAMLEERVRNQALPDTAAAVGTLDEPAAQAQTWGHAADEICRYASEHDVDLIVIGSHGRSGIRRVILGSVSNAVANQASCPVTVVR